MPRRVFLLMLICLSAWQVRAQSNLVMTIQMRQTTIKSGSPVLLMIKYENTGNQVMLITSSRIPNMMSGIAVKDGNGKMIMGSHEPKGLPFISAHDFLLKPRASTTETMDVARIYNLVGPGTYTVFVEKKVAPNEAKVRSNEITFTIVQ